MTEKKKRIVLVILTLLLLVIVAYLATNGFKKTRVGEKSPSPSPSIIKGNSTLDEPSPTPTPKGSTSSPLPAAKPSKPTLQKSSGNAPGSSVPSGAIVEFTCEGTPNAYCEIVLTDRSNGSNTITLDKKTIAPNNRDQYFAIWDWTAVKGSWNIIAKSSNSAGDTVVSDTQTLEVK